MRSLATRLTVLVTVIVLGAIVIVALGVLPTLRGALERQEVDRLAAEARRHSPRIGTVLRREEPAGRVVREVRSVADAASARVTLLGVARTPAGAQTVLKADSLVQRGAGGLRFPAAVTAAQDRRSLTTFESGDEGRVGEAIVPIFMRRPPRGRGTVVAVAVFTRPLDDVTASVALVQKRILVAGAAALAIATLAAFLIARALSGRVRRLEHVADRVAVGDFTARFPRTERDELGHLARALDDMRDQLAELDSARSRFIATASHELRTPLFSLAGFLELLEDEDVSEHDRRRFITELRAQVTRMQGLATDLLDLSRLESGALELREEPTDLSELARDVARAFEPRVAAHGAHLELRLPDGPLRARCDPERVAQLLGILLDNAVTHTPHGTDVVVAASRRNGRVRLGVADYGPGIGRQMLPRVFEPFSTTDDAHGAGLGLAIADELASRMRGSLEVESRPGLTTFTFTM